MRHLGGAVKVRQSLVLVGGSSPLHIRRHFLILPRGLGGSLHGWRNSRPARSLLPGLSFELVLLAPLLQTPLLAALLGQRLTRRTEADVENDLREVLESLVYFSGFVMLACMKEFRRLKSRKPCISSMNDSVTFGFRGSILVEIKFEQQEQQDSNGATPNYRGQEIRRMAGGGEYAYRGLPCCSSLLSSLLWKKKQKGAQSAGRTQGQQVERLVVIVDSRSE